MIVQEQVARVAVYVSAHRQIVIRSESDVYEDALVVLAPANVPGVIRALQNILKEVRDA